MVRRTSGQAGQKSTEEATAAAVAPEKMTLSLLWKRYGYVALGTHFSL
jgi:hypothetical protein